jgi:hypothetical protein
MSNARHRPRLDRARRDTPPPPVAACIVPAADVPDDDDDAPEEVAPGSLATVIAEALAREAARKVWARMLVIPEPTFSPRVAPPPVKRHKPGSTRHLNPQLRQERGNDGQH